MKAIVHRDEDRTKAMLFSLILHLGMLALLIFYKFSVPEKAIEPTPVFIELEMGGGGDDAAAGEPDRGMNSTSAPEGEPAETVAEAPVEEAPAEPVPTPPAPTPPPKSEPKPSSTKPTPTTEDPAVAALRRQQEEAKRKEQDRIRQEQEKVASAERERQRIAQEAAAEKARQEQARRDKIKNSGLGGGGTGGTGAGTGTGGKPGNQGIPGGTGDNPFGKSSGSGGGTGGGVGTGTGASVGGGLSNRKITNRASPSYNSQEKGTVRVKVCVDSDGRVVEATPTQSGSTTASGTLRAAAQRAAQQWRFGAAPGTDRECGWIDFNFILK